jgi:hypothetical protein
MATQLRTRRSVGNPLIRRVQRHADLATLFRSPQGPEMRFIQQPTGLAPVAPSIFLSQDEPDLSQTGTSTTPAVPLVQPTLVPVSSQAKEVEQTRAPSKLPGITWPAQMQSPDTNLESQSTPEILKRAESEPTPATTPTASAYTPPTLQRASEPATQTVSTGSAQLEAEPSSQPEAPPAGREDRIWNRLQNIFRKHQEKQAQEETAVGPAATSGSETATPEPEKQTGQVQRAQDPQPSLPAKAREAERASEQAPPPAQPPTPAGPARPEERLPEQRPASQPEPERLEQVETISDRQAFSPGDETPAPDRSSLPPAPVKAQPTPPSLEEVAASDQAFTEPAGVPEEELSGKPASEPQGEKPESTETMETRASQPETGPQATQISAPPTLQSEPSSPAANLQPQPHITRTESPTVQPVEPGPSADQTLISRPTPSPGPPEMDRPTQFVSTAELTPPAEDYALQAPDEPEGQQAHQPLPLEEVWPVQHLQEREIPSVETRLPAPRAELAHSPEAHQVSSLLQDVTPGQPTDSAVEVVTPRRPRPAAPVQTRPQEQPATRPPEASAGEKTAVQLAPDLVPTPEDQIVVPSSPEADRPAEAMKEPGLVPTEIGELPTDLWRLIGQEPPLAAPTPPSPLQRQAESGLEPALPAVLPAERKSRAEGQYVTYQAPTTLQRAEAPETTEPAPQASDDEAGDAEGANLDELSRRVYQEVKRRLANEWERMRRRL